MIAMSHDPVLFNDELKNVLQHLSQHAFPHVPNPEGCEKRASVAVILRIRPAFEPHSNPVLDENLNARQSPEGRVVSQSDKVWERLEALFSQSWIRHGDPEIMFIKRAGRIGDRWSGHIALPGGKRDPEDANDLSAAIRETREEVGLDLQQDTCISVGKLAERVVTTAGSKVGLMVLCPYLFVLTKSSVPPLQPQPTEVAAIHWVPLRALLSPTQRTRELVDISSRFAKQGGPFVAKLLRAVIGKMMFSAIRLIPSESLYASSAPGFVPSNQYSMVSSALGRDGLGFTSRGLGTHQPVLLLWGLTLGILADFLNMLPPHNAIKLWKYPTFNTPDLRLFVYLFTLPLRNNNAGDLSSGTWRSQIAVDATTKAVAIPEGEAAGTSNRNDVITCGVAVGSSPKHAAGKLLSGYYERLNVAIGCFLVYRTVLGTLIGMWLWRRWKRRTR